MDAPGRAGASPDTDGLPRVAGPGLTLRRATPTDGERLVAFNRLLQGETAAAHVAYLLDGQHPDFRADDFLVVVDRDGRIVSSLCLLEVRWRLGHTTLTLGQPEYVGTLPEFRGRGLIRRQFEIAHRRMTKRGLAFGLIGGVPYYYRTFGYEYAVDFSSVGTLTAAEHRARIASPPGVAVRRAEEGDVPALIALAEGSAAGADIGTEVREPAWRWSTRANRLDATGAEDWIALRNGRPIGSARVRADTGVLSLDWLTGDEVAAAALIGAAFAAPGATVVRIGMACPPTIRRWIAALALRPGHPNALQIRVNDPPAALRQLAPELERRIAASPFAGLSQPIDLGFYRHGLRLVVEAGRIAAVAPLPGEQEPRIGIPPDVLPKLLFGYRDIDQLADVYPDLYARDRDAWMLLRALFPRLTSYVRYFV